jgi:WD40 repeat protein
MFAPKWRIPIVAWLVLISDERAAFTLRAAEKKPLIDRYGDPLPKGAISRLGTTRFRHTSQVVSIAYTPDGALMATGGYDAAVRVWETGTGKERYRFSFDREPHYDGSLVAFSQDGKHLAAAGGDAYSIWDVTTGEVQLKQRLPKGERALAIAFAAGGKTLVVLNWRSAGVGAKTETVLRSLPVDRSAKGGLLLPAMKSIRSLSVSPDGKTLALGKEDGLLLIDAKTGKQSRVLPLERNLIRRNAISANGVLATTGAEKGSIHLWDAVTGEKKRELAGHTAHIRHLAFSADGRRLVSSGDDTFRVWDVASGEAVVVHQGNASAGVGCVALSPDGKAVAEGSINGVFRVGLWNVATGKEVAGPQGHFSPIKHVAFSKDGKILTAGGYGDPTVRVWEPANGKQLAVFQEPDFLHRLAFSPDGRSVAFAKRDHTISLRDLATDKDKGRLAGNAGSVQALAFAPDGKTLAVGYCQTTKGYVCTMILWDVASGKKIRQLQTPGASINSVAFSPDGKKLLSANSGIRQWDPQTGDALGDLPTKGTGVSGHDVLRFSPDGIHLAAPSYPTGFGVWKLATREFVGRFDGDGLTVRSVAFSADGCLFACGKEDGTVELWQVQNWKVLGKGQGPRGRVYVVRFAADDSMLISGHADTTALVWDVAAMLK